VPEAGVVKPARERRGGVDEGVEVERRELLALAPGVAGAQQVARLDARGQVAADEDRRPPFALGLEQQQRLRRRQPGGGRAARASPPRGTV
jgi:hypothetical protein